MQSKKTKHAPRSSTGGEQVRRPLIIVIKAVTVGLLATTVLLLLFSLLFCRQDLPFSLLNPLTTFILVISALTSGYLAARSLGRHGLLVGGGCGASIFLILLLASIQVPFQIDWSASLKLLISLFSGAIGGIMGVNVKKKIKNHKN